MSNKVVKKINDKFSEECDRAMKQKFGDLDFETVYNIFTMSHITHWKKTSLKKRKILQAYCSAWADGYAAAMNVAGT